MRISSCFLFLPNQSFTYTAKNLNIVLPSFSLIQLSPSVLDGRNISVIIILLSTLNHKKVFMHNQICDPVDLHGRDLRFPTVFRRNKLLCMHGNHHPTTPAPYINDPFSFSQKYYNFKLSTRYCTCRSKSNVGNQQQIWLEGFHHVFPSWLKSYIMMC